MTEGPQLPPRFWRSALNVLGVQALTLVLLWLLQVSFAG